MKRVSILVDEKGMVRFSRDDGTSQPLFRVDDTSVIVWDRRSKSECILPAKRIGNTIIIDLSLNPDIDPLIRESK